jgi:hypothetical protein
MVRKAGPGRLVKQLAKAVLESAVDQKMTDR